MNRGKTGPEKNETSIATLQVNAMVEPSESIIAAASKLPPRDLEAVENSIKAAIVRSPHIARRCLYCKPVGKKDNRQTFAIGPSVRFSEIAMQHFGKMWLRTYLIDETPIRGPKQPGTVTTESILFDLQTLNIYTAQDTSPVWSENSRETSRDRSFSFSRRDAIMQAAQPQWVALERDVKRTVLFSFAPEGQYKTEQAREDAADKAAWAYLVAEFGRYLGGDKKRTEQALMAITSREYERTDRLYKLLGILNWLNDGNQDKAGDVFGGMQNGNTGKPDVTETVTEPAGPAQMAPKAVVQPAATATPLPAELASKERATFEEVVRGFAMSCGITTDAAMSEVLLAEFGITGGLPAVPEKDFNHIVDRFMAKAGV